jgi:hypothetical protein
LGNGGRRRHEELRARSIPRQRNRRWQEYVLDRLQWRRWTQKRFPAACQQGHGLLATLVPITWAGRRFREGEFKAQQSKMQVPPMAVDDLRVSQIAFGKVMGAFVTVMSMPIEVLMIRTVVVMNPIAVRQRVHVTDHRRCNGT